MMAVILAPGRVQTDCGAEPWSQYESERGETLRGKMFPVRGAKSVRRTRRRELRAFCGRARDDRPKARVYLCCPSLHLRQIPAERSCRARHMRSQLRKRLP